MQLLDVQMSVSDPWQAASFYEQILDLPVVRREGSVQVSVGSSTLTLRPGGESGGGSHHLALTVQASQFDQAKRRLSDRTPLLRRDGADEFTLPAPWRSRSIYFSGPDATLLELIARRDLPEPTPRDSPRGPLCVSEVGVAVDDADTVAGDLHATFGLGRFDAGGPGFVPGGDHHGLGIRRGRGKQAQRSDARDHGQGSGPR